MLAPILSNPSILSNPLQSISILPSPSNPVNLYACTLNSLIYPLHLFYLMQSLLTHPCFFQTRWITSNPLLSVFLCLQSLHITLIPFPSFRSSPTLSSLLQLYLIPLNFIWFCPIPSYSVSSNPILSDPLQSRPIYSLYSPSSCNNSCYYFFVGIKDECLINDRIFKITRSRLINFGGGPFLHTPWPFLPTLTTH